MQSSKYELIPSVSSSVGVSDTLSESTVVLVVGGGGQRRAGYVPDSGSRNVMHVDYSSLDAGILEQAAPNMVVSPTMCASFDCLELAEQLSGLGYRGKYRVFCEDLPRPDIVKREVRLAYPFLDFDIVTHS